MMIRFDQDSPDARRTQGTKMRVEKSNSTLHVKAVAETHVILLAFKPSRSALNDLRGFAIKRSANGGQPVWLKGLKYFEGAVHDPQPGDEYSSYDQPFQTFFWSDYAATPDATYKFTMCRALASREA